MDRDKRWDRVQRAWNLIVDGVVDAKGAHAGNAVAAVEAAYAAGVTDEFVEPTVITDGPGAPVGIVKDGDGVFFWNFRADRARELTWAFMQDGFDGFPIARRPRVHYLTHDALRREAGSAGASTRRRRRSKGLAEILAAAGLRNLRTAETEKYAHVTYFFNGGREEPWPGEVRRLVPSPKVATYDLQPEMSAPEVAGGRAGGLPGQRVRRHRGELRQRRHGRSHRRLRSGGRRAFRTLDRLLSEIMPPSLDRGTVWLVTADHGNCDEMLGPGGEVMTQHSLNKVPFILAGKRFAGRHRSPAHRRRRAGRHRPHHPLVARFAATG